MNQKKYLKKRIKQLASKDKASKEVDKKDFEFQKQLTNLEYFFDRGINFADRIIHITEVIDEPLFEIVDIALTIMEKENKRRTVTIKIHSIGGNLYEALAVVGRIKASSCHIVTEGFGTIMSAATLIFASGDSRKMSHTGWGMLHQPSYSVDWDKMAGHEAALEQAKNEWKRWSELMATYTGHKDSKYWYALGKHADAYFTPEKMLETNLATEII